MPAKNYYVVLGVSRDEPSAGIRSAYHQLARRTHPDISGSAGTTQEVKEAYEVLSDPERRCAHDRECEGTLRREVPVRHQAADWPVFPEPISMFGKPEQIRPSFDAFRERYFRNFTGWNVPKAEQAESLTLDVILTPTEALYGCVVPVGVPVFSACPECGGTGQIVPFHCIECAGSGFVEEQRTLEVRVPPRVQAGTVLESPLGMVGIDNLYLRVHISISAAF
jgi:molecular chaperone DnaJ